MWAENRTRKDVGMTSSEMNEHQLWAMKEHLCIQDSLRRVKSKSKHLENAHEGVGVWLSWSMNGSLSSAALTQDQSLILF